MSAAIRLSTMTSSHGFTEIPWPKAVRDMFRYTDRRDYAQLISALNRLPLQAPQGALESFQNKQFADPLFADENWVTFATRFLVQEQLSIDDYAALMVYDGCQMGGLTFEADVQELTTPSSFTQITAQTLDLFAPDFIQGCKNRFPEKILTTFIQSLTFNTPSSDCIFVIKRQFSTPLITALEEQTKLITKVDGNCLLMGKKGMYVFSPKTLKKFLHHLKRDGCGIWEVSVDLIHGALSPENDFEDVGTRPVFLPGRYFKNPAFVHHRNTEEDPLGIYLHDLYAHILTLQCYIPPSHGRIWTYIARSHKQTYPHIYNKIVDFVLSYNPLLFGSKTGAEIFNVDLDRLVDLFNNEINEESLTEILLRIPHLLQEAGLRLVDGRMQELHD
jgi:hypothetical protein